MEQTIQEKLLAYYKQCLAEAPKEDAGALKVYCNFKNIDRGVCYCATHVFDERIYWKDWVKKYCNVRTFWAIAPDALFTIPDIINALQVRIDILQKIVDEQKVVA